MNNQDYQLTVKDLRMLSGMSQTQFASFFDIPLNNIKNWESENKDNSRKPKHYLVQLMEFKLTALGAIDKVELDELKKKRGI